MISKNNITRSVKNLKQLISRCESYGEFGEAFDDRRKIGAAIGEYVADPGVAEGLQISLGDRGGFCARVVHKISPHTSPPIDSCGRIKFVMRVL